MTATVTVRDEVGDITFSMDDLRRYHGRDFLNGLAQAIRVISFAGERLNGGRPMRRRQIRLVLGLDPPGVVDGFECVTRAFSDRRAIIDRRIGIGPESYDGHYYFEVQYEGRRLALALRAGVVPDRHTALARRGFARLLSPEESAEWAASKSAVAERMLTAPVLELFDIVAEGSP